MSFSAIATRSRAHGTGVLFEGRGESLRVDKGGVETALREGLENEGQGPLLPRKGEMRGLACVSTIHRQNPSGRSSRSPRARPATGYARTAVLSAFEQEITVGWCGSVTARRCHLPAESREDQVEAEVRECPDPMLGRLRDGDGQVSFRRRNEQDAARQHSRRGATRGGVVTFGINAGECPPLVLAQEWAWVCAL